jgi:cytochrome P450
MSTLTFSDGTKWHKRRKMMTPTFHFDILKNYHPIMNDKACVITNILLEEAKKQTEIELLNFLKNCTLDIICGEHIEFIYLAKLTLHTKTKNYFKKDIK